ncbi:MAG: DNA polymerase III subunit [Planctomycetes bacterium]|nr:DNA polymerase III subunit [Planctomycetota bacterium]
MGSCDPPGDARYDALGAGAHAGASLARDFFRGALASGRIAHAYVLVGPRGAGKKRIAEEVAAAGLCEGRIRPCGTCASCRRAASGSHPSIWVLDPEGRTIDIDAIRSLRDSLTLRSGTRRFWIVADCDRMTTEAANAFLKTLEEPLGETVLLLTTARPGALLPTILSRAQRIPFFLPAGASEEAAPAEPSAEFPALRDPAALRDRDPRALLGIPASGELEAVRERIRGVIARALEAGRAAIEGGLEERPGAAAAAADAEALAWSGKDPLAVAGRLRRLLAAAEDLDRFVNPDLVLEEVLAVLAAPSARGVAARAPSSSGGRRSE